MKFQIGSERYDLQALDRLTLAEILRLEFETESLGRPMKWSQVRAMAEALDGLTAEEFEAHDDSLWVVALGIWVSRLRQGEAVTLAEAIDFPLSDLKFLPEPGDHKPGKASKSPKGSAGGAKPQANGGTSTAAKTSEPPSSPA